MSREEEPGLLGNLPRSRPGTRSDKRPDERTQRQAPTSARTARATTAPEDRVGEALRTAANAAGAGLRVANGMTRELLRRLPRRR